MIVPPLSPAREAILDLMPPALLQQLVAYQLKEADSDWESRHIEAVADICNYIDTVYKPSNSRSELVRAADKLRKHLSIESND